MQNARATTDGPGRAFVRMIASGVILAMLAGCATKEDREKWATVAAVVAIGALVYSAAKYGGGGGGTASAVDYDWDWDEFYSQGRLVWACRGVQTGQFAEAAHCTYKLKTDNRWPQK